MVTPDGGAVIKVNEIVDRTQPSPSLSTNWYTKVRQTEEETVIDIKHLEN